MLALYSLLQDKAVQCDLVVLEEMTIQTNILPLRSLPELLQMTIDNGAKRVLIPFSNWCQMLEVPPDVLACVDPIFCLELLVTPLNPLRDQLMKSQVGQSSAQARSRCLPVRLPRGSEVVGKQLRASGSRRTTSPSAG